METITSYYSFNFSIWFDDKDKKIQIKSDWEIVETIKKLTAKYLGFGTISKVNEGVYTYNDGSIATEKSVNVNFKSQNFDKLLIRTYIENLKKQLNQESILFSYTKENVEFL
jgi:hypothetical protein